MKKVLKISLIVFFIMTIIVAIIGVIFITNIMNETKNVTFDKNKIISATKQINVYSDNGELVENTSVDGKKIVPLSDLKDDTINCFLSIEDKNFYKHNGVNYKRIAKAMLNNIKSHSFKEGASTISQQLIKNTHLSNEKTLKRKVKEIVLTKKLEKAFTKDEILETYLNVIYFGDGCYGIEEASNHYFNKPAKELNLIESATLAGLIKAPSIYSPTKDYESSLKRRNLVLNSLFNDGYISDEEYKKYSEKPIELNIQINNDNDGIYLENVKKEAEKILNMSLQQITLNNYKIYTYLDTEKQKSLVETLKDENYYHKNTFGNVADSLGIIIDNHTFGVSAMYGKSKYDLSNFKRQPGSAIKPILVYAPALEYGEISNCSQILDEKIDYNGYSPNNVGNHFYGYVSVRDAVAKSLNVPAVKVMDYVGIERCKNFAKKTGITFNEYDTGYALALGGFNEGVSLKDLVNSYTPFVNNGNYVPAKFIKKITTASNVVVYENKPEPIHVMGEDTAYLMTDLLRDGVYYGTSSRLRHLPFQVAGKTGTVAIKGTNQNSDVYSIAYTTNDTIGIWLGNYTFDPEYNLEGSNNGGTYCTDMVKNVLDEINTTKPTDFMRPDNVVTLKIDEKNLSENHTIKLADETCPDRYTIEEIFAERFKPTEYSDTFSNITCNYSVDYDKSENTAKIKVEAKDYLIYDVYCNNHIISTIENKSGEQIINYSDFAPNSMYTFYVVVRNGVNDVEVKSNETSIFTKNIFECLIDDKILESDDKTLSWYFM